MTTFLQLSIVDRYIETIISPYPPVPTRNETTSPDAPEAGRSDTTSLDPPVTGRSETTSPDRCRIYFLAKLRYLETITESAPQLCLQVYIMSRQWDFPSYTVVSSVLSLLSLAWSIMTLEKERKIKEKDYKISARVCYLIWQLSTLVSRLSAIVIFAYVFRYYVIIFLAAHWLPLLVAILIILERREYSDRKSLIFSCLAAYPSLFHSSKTFLPTASPNVEMLVGYILIVLENIVMLTFSLTMEIPDLPHMDILNPVGISCIVGGSVLSIVFIVLYYWCDGAYQFDLRDVVTRAIGTLIVISLVYS